MHAEALWNDGSGLYIIFLNLTRNKDLKTPLLRILCCSVPYLVCGFCARKSFLPKVEDDSVKGQQKCNGRTKTLSQTQDFQFNRKFRHAQIHKTFFLTFLPQSSLKYFVFHILNDCWIEVIFMTKMHDYCTKITLCS